MGEPDLSDLPPPTTGAELYLRAILAELRMARPVPLEACIGTVELREPDIVAAVHRAQAKSATPRRR